MITRKVRAYAAQSAASALAPKQDVEYRLVVGVTGSHHERAFHLWEGTSLGEWRTRDREAELAVVRH